MTHYNVLEFEALMAGLYTNYEGVRDLRVTGKRALEKSGSIKAWCDAWHKKVQRKELVRKKRKNLRRRKMHRSWQKKNWKKLTWGLTHRNQDLS